MLGLCELSSCRRQALLAYFDETLSEPCGNCDTCLHPPETWDGTQSARKALSCVFRTGQRFGVNYLIDVLLGKDNERIQNNLHHKLSTYGIGEEHTGVEWRGVYRQLIALGYLTADLEGHGTLLLTEKSRPLLRGEQQLQLRKQRKTEKTRKEKTNRPQVDLSEDDDVLFRVLRGHRLSLARERGVPSYVIFHDRTLQEMAVRRPESLAEMGEISGIGEHKLEAFGESFLELITA